MVVVMLHALRRSGRTMRRMSSALVARGHSTHVIDYDTRGVSLHQAATAVANELRRRGLGGSDVELNFVAHSMGGIVLRALGEVVPGFRCGRSVLLGVPYQGSTIAERCAHHPALRLFFGRTLAELKPENVSRLPPVPGPFAVIAGRSWNPLIPSAYLLSYLAPREPSDSVVLVRETFAPEARVSRVIDGINTFLPQNRTAIRLAQTFLETGTFGPQ